MSLTYKKNKHFSAGEQSSTWIFNSMHVVLYLCQSLFDDQCIRCKEKIKFCCWDQIGVQVSSMPCIKWVCACMCCSLWPITELPKHMLSPHMFRHQVHKQLCCSAHKPLLTFSPEAAAESLEKINSSSSLGPCFMFCFLHSFFFTEEVIQILFCLNAMIEQEPPNSSCNESQPGVGLCVCWQAL